MLCPTEKLVLSFGEIPRYCGHHVLSLALHHWVLQKGKYSNVISLETLRIRMENKNKMNRSRVLL